MGLGAAVAQAFAALIVFRWVPHRTQSNLLEPPRTSSNPFVSVFRTREAMDYIVGYAAHMWELFAMRSWLVRSSHSLSRQPDGAGGSTAAAAASIVTLVGVPASIGGQEVASRIGPRRHIVRMAASAAVAAIVGWMAPLAVSSRRAALLDLQHHDLGRLGAADGRRDCGGAAWSTRRDDGRAFDAGVRCGVRRIACDRRARSARRRHAACVGHRIHRNGREQRARSLALKKDVAQPCRAASKLLPVELGRWHGG